MCMSPWTDLKSGQFTQDTVSTARGPGVEPASMPLEAPVLSSGTYSSLWLCFRQVFCLYSAG